MQTKENSKFTYDIVADILRGYRELNQIATQLRNDIAHYFPSISDEDIIETMTFSRILSKRINKIHNGKTSDRTAFIAMSYSESVDKVKIRPKCELENELKMVLSDINRIECYVGLLSEQSSVVLQKLYFEYKTHAEVADEINISVSTLKRHRNDGIAQLVPMFNLITT